MEQETLYQRIGGKEAIEAAVDIFYDKIMKDSMLTPFFSNTDMNSQRRKQKVFLAYAFGGLPSYNGKNLREAHAHLIEKGLNDTHFDKVAGHLSDTLNELQVPDSIINEVIGLVGSTRDDVLNR